MFSKQIFSKLFLTIYLFLTDGDGNKIDITDSDRKVAEFIGIGIRSLIFIGCLFSNTGRFLLDICSV